MAVVGGLEVPDDLLELFKKLVSVSDNRRRGAVRKHGYLMTPQRKRAISSRSLLPEIRELKKTLSPADVNDWKAAALASRQNWWNLFVQDTAYRLKYGLAGLADPSTLHQYKVGRIELKNSATRVLLRQYHPEKYWVNKKIKGNTTQREDVAVFEPFQLPLVFGFSYRSNLMSAGPAPRALMRARIFSNYQGRTIETEAVIDCDLQAMWERKTLEVTEVQGVARSYELDIELIDVKGAFEWDNVEARHTGTNWARDWRCTDVNNELTIYNFQIEASWEEQFLPAGAAFASVYPTDSPMP